MHSRRRGRLDDVRQTCNPDAIDSEGGPNTSPASLFSSALNDVEKRKRGSKRGSYSHSPLENQVKSEKFDCVIGEATVYEVKIKTGRKGRVIKKQTNQRPVL